MNQPLLLHIVERLEGLLGKLPATIQKPILHELTPLKELFLQQRAPRFLLAGSDKTPPLDLLSAIFETTTPFDSIDHLPELFTWQNFNAAGRGALRILDARGADKNNAAQIREEIDRELPDLILYVDLAGARASRSHFEQLDKFAAGAKIAGISILDPERTKRSRAVSNNVEELKEKLRAKFGDRMLDVFEIDPAQSSHAALLAFLTRNLPNDARVEMIRISRDRAAQQEVAHVLVKSTTAICTAIGAQPIPLADLPILTTLQLVMVSGIMYVSGRERSLRAATEFIAALGANVGAGMILREGARAVLKFFPGWGNIVCGMVAGAGTYAIGKSATAYFLEGVSLKDARRTYFQSRKRSARQLQNAKIERPTGRK